MGYMIDADEFQGYFNEQTKAAQELLSDLVNNSTDIFDDSSLNNMIATWVEQGLSLEEMEKAINDIANNKRLKDAMDTFYESLLDPEADS